MSGAGAMGFRWVEVVEKEFDKAFVDLDVILGEIDEEQSEIIMEGRDRLTRLSTAFAQLCHKSQSVFHHNSHLETQLVTMRSEVCQLRSLKTVQERQINDLVYQIHDAQLQLCHLKDSSSSTKDASSPLRNGLVDPDVIRQKLQNHKIQTQSKEGGGERDSLEQRRLIEELEQVKKENAVWKQQALTLRGEVLGAKLAGKYTAKELSGRVQQLQLLIREKDMKLDPEMQQKLWNQLEAEINLHRHKTIIRECRSGHSQSSSNMNLQNGPTEEPAPGELRTAVIRKKEHQKNLGISVTGGKEHGVPVLVSEIHPDTAAADCGNLFVGDAILFVNGLDLREVPHENAVKMLSEAAALQEITLEVLFIHPDPDELATREGETRAEVEKELDVSEYPIFDPNLLRFKGLTVQTNDEYNGLDTDPRFWGGPSQQQQHPPFIHNGVVTPNLVIDDGSHQPQALHPQQQQQQEWSQQHWTTQQQHRQNGFHETSSSHQNHQMLSSSTHSLGEKSPGGAVETVVAPSVVANKESIIPPSTAAAAAASSNKKDVNASSFDSIVAQEKTSEGTAVEMKRVVDSVRADGAGSTADVERFEAGSTADVERFEAGRVVDAGNEDDAETVIEAGEVIDKDVEDGTLDEEELALTTRIGSRLSQHSNSQMIDFSQLERPTSTEERVEPDAASPPIWTDSGATIHAERNMSPRQQHDMRQPAAAFHAPPLYNGDSLHHVKPPPLCHSIPPNQNDRSHRANAHHLPPMSAGSSAQSMMLPPAAAAQSVLASATTAPMPPSTKPSHSIENSFSQSAYSYPVLGGNEASPLNPFPYPVVGGRNEASSSSSSSEVPCAYPYPRNREEILKGAMMLSPSSIAGLGGSRVSRYYLPPTQEIAGDLNQSPPPLGYKNRDTKILY